MTILDYSLYDDDWVFQMPWMVRRIAGVASLAALMHIRYMRHYICRIETILIGSLVISLWIYVRWLTDRHRHLIKGATLARFDLQHVNGGGDTQEFARIIELGFCNLTRLPDNVWQVERANFCYYAMQGVRISMEDRMHYLRDPFNANLSIYGIFDGHGGKFVSEYLENTFSRSIRNRLINFGDRTRRDSIMSGGLESATVVEAIITEAHNIDDAISRLDPAFTSLTGSTLIAAIVQHNRFVSIVNVGDSRAVACDRDGIARPLSIDHKPTNTDERKRIESAGGFVQWNGVDRVQGILATSRAFGDTYLKRLDVITAHPDVQHVDIDHDRIAFIILASDGLWDVVSNQNAVNIVREHINTIGNGCREAARHLVRTAIELGSLDNVSVFVIRFDNAPSSS